MLVTLVVGIFGAREHRRCKGDGEAGRNNNGNKFLHVSFSSKFATNWRGEKALESNFVAAA